MVQTLSKQEVIAYVTSRLQNISSGNPLESSADNVNVDAHNAGSLPAPGHKFVWYEHAFLHKEHVLSVLSLLRGPLHQYKETSYKGHSGQTNPVPPIELDEDTVYEFIMVPVSMLEAFNAECIYFFRSSCDPKENSGMESGYRLVQCRAVDHYRLEVCDLESARIGLQACLTL